jgi:hypothetical protein
VTVKVFQLRSDPEAICKATNKTKIAEQAKKDGRQKPRLDGEEEEEGEVGPRFM